MSKINIAAARIATRRRSCRTYAYCSRNSSSVELDFAALVDFLFLLPAQDDKPDGKPAEAKSAKTTIRLLFTRYG